MGGYEWKEDEDKIIIDMVKNEGATSGDIHRSRKLPFRTSAAIACRITKLKLKLRSTYRRWTDEEVWKAYIMYHQDYSIREIADELHRGKDTTGTKITNERLIYQPTSVPCPEHLQPIVDELMGVAK